MFKKSSGEGKLGTRFSTSRLALAAVLVAAGCRTAAPLDRVDLANPAWTVREGQAVWHPGGDKPELAGEVLVAWRADGASFVQFTKTPFPVLVGFQTARRWQVELPGVNRRYAGRGTPPKRLIWLWLPRLLSGEAPPRGWSWEQTGEGWRLATGRGESAKGFLNP